MKITKLQGGPEDYIKNHKASGLVVGDLVHISRAPATREGGWGSVFIDSMQFFVGKTFEIVDDEEEVGFRLKNVFDDESNRVYDNDSNYCLWPYFVLDKVERVKDKVLVKHTKDTTIKLNKMPPFIFHSPRTVFKKAYTLVGILDETKAIATMHIGLSVCSDGDNFNENFDIAFATGHARKTPLFILQLTVEEQKQTLQKFMSFANTFTPSFALQTKLKLEAKL